MRTRIAHAALALLLLPAAAYADHVVFSNIRVGLPRASDGALIMQQAVNLATNPVVSTATLSGDPFRVGFFVDFSGGQPPLETPSASPSHRQVETPHPPR